MRSLGDTQLASGEGAGKGCGREPCMSPEGGAAFPAGDGGRSTRTEQRLGGPGPLAPNPDLVHSQAEDDQTPLDAFQLPATHKGAPSPEPEPTGEPQGRAEGPGGAVLSATEAPGMGGRIPLASHALSPTGSVATWPVAACGMHADLEHSR